MSDKLVEIYKVYKHFDYKKLEESFLMPINDEEDIKKVIKKLPWSTFYYTDDYHKFIEGAVDVLEGDIINPGEYGYGFAIIIKDQEDETSSNNTLDKPDELVTVPKFVDRWIKCTQQDGDDGTDDDAKADSIHFAIYGLFANYPNTNPEVHIRKPVLDWLDNRENYSVLFKALLYGYELEETKYYAKIKGWDSTIAKRVFWHYNGISSEPDLTDEKYPFSNDVFKTMEEWAEIGINETNAEFFEEK